MILPVMLNVFKKTCREEYIGETGRVLSERVIDYSGRDKNSHVLKHCIKKEHKLRSLKKFMNLRTDHKKNSIITAYQMKTLILKHAREICSVKTA